MYTEHHENRGGSFAAGMLFGAAVGATLGCIFAPRSGAETRRQLAETTSRLRRTAEEGLEEAQRKGGDLASRGSEMVDRGRTETYGEASREPYTGNM